MMKPVITKDLLVMEILILKAQSVLLHLNHNNCKNFICASFEKAK